MLKKLLFTTAMSVMLVSCASDAKKDDGDYMVETRNDTMTNANPVEDARRSDDMTVKEIKHELDEKNVYFSFDSNTIRKTEKDKLKEAAKMINTLPANTSVVVKGYTDAVGSKAYNEDLAMRRAQAAKSLLVDYGVPATKLRTKSLGESKANMNTDNQTNQAWGFKDEDRKVSFDIMKEERDGMSQNSSTSAEKY